MSRAAIEAHARWSRGFLRPTRDDVFANHAQLNFGMSLFDVHTSLCSGAALVLVPDAVRQFPDRVADLLARERVSVWFSGPGILSLLAGLPDLAARDLSRLRAVAFAGEPFPAPALRRLRARLPHPRYFNFYGSTETNVAACYELPRGVDFDLPPPLGRPCAHFEARVMAAGGAGPAAKGSVGELQLRGPGLDAGYLGQPELSAERILPAPDGGAPWYRTTDLVVELPSGDLRYAGRLGRMVKLRGYRVEPGEIETRLHEHPRVAAAAVVPVEGPRGLVLVAHLATQPEGQRLPVVELKRFCAHKLPAYMVPERFVFHAALPRNLRGKIDFEALRGEA
jgi:acyl-coenzyme A synthetase/AMP-(fatty) acid ligase